MKNTPIIANDSISKSFRRSSWFRAKRKQLAKTFTEIHKEIQPKLEALQTWDAMFVKAPKPIGRPPGCNMLSINGGDGYRVILP